ncbi:hypothetical protein [Mesorhizobium sp. M0859]|uniref:hypothetical protein n=1 Tax=Mesorhizobium sp. M0859 TaxID=2957014 RepID=UPI00333868DD
MSTATLGFEIRSEQALTAKSNLDKMTASAAQAEAAQQKLAAASAGSNAALLRIASGVDTANALLAKLVAATDASTASSAKYVAGARQVETANIAGARSAEVVVAAQRQTAVATDQATAALGRQNAAVVTGIAAAAKARAAAGVDVWGRTAAEVAATRTLGAGNSKIPAIPVAAPAAARVAEAAAVTGVASAGTGAISAFGAALTSIISPATAVQFVIFSLAGAAVQYFSEWKNGAKATEEMLKRHAETLKAVKEQYGELAEMSGKITAGPAFTMASARDSSSVINARIREQMAPFMSSLSGGGILPSWMGGGSGSVDQLRNLTQAQAPFAAAVKELLDNIRNNNPDLNQFDETLASITQKLAATSGNPTGLQNIADGLSAIGHSVFDVNSKFTPFMAQIDRLKVEGAAGLSRFNAEVEAIGQQKGLQSLADQAILLGKDIIQLTNQARELKAVLDAIDREDTRPGLADRRALGGYVNRRAADLDALNAQADAERQMVRARTNAERLAAVEAQVRARAREEGDTGGGLQARVDRALDEERNRQAVEERNAADDRHRAQLRSIASAREELTLIGATTGETAKLRYEYWEIARLKDEAYKRGGLVSPEEEARVRETAIELGKIADLQARLNLDNDLTFERSQQFLSEREQAISSRLRGTGIGMDSPEAQAMRDMNQFADAKELAQGFLTDFKSELLRNGGDVGEALGTAILNALTASMDKQLSDIFDRLATWIAAALTGQRPGAGLGGGAGFAANTTLSAFLGASNDNYAPGAVTRSPLAAVGAAGMSQYAAAIRSIESAGSGGYSALGPWTNGDRAYGAYQVMGNNIPSWSQDALGKSLTPDQFLSDPAAQDAIFQKQFGKYLTKYGNPQDAASAWFTGGPLKSGAGATDVLGTSGSVYVDKFNKAVEKAAGSLDGLDSTVTSTVKSLAGGVGGASGGLASILEGLKPANFQANTSLSAILGYGGTPAPSAAGGGGGGFLSMLLGFLPGLFGFADGTENAPEGWAWVGERGPELRKLRGGDTIRSHGHSMDMAANSNMSARGGGRGQEGRVEFNLNIDGANGDPHVRMLARQAAEEAIAQYHQAQASGGFGELQRQYASQKG